MSTQVLGNTALQPVEAKRQNIKHRYLEALTLIERLHRRLLDVIKDDFERTGEKEVNPVQALLLFNISDAELTAGELKTRGHYQGSNVSYNLKKLVEADYVNHERSANDKRSVRISLRRVVHFPHEPFRRLSKTSPHGQCASDHHGRVTAAHRSGAD